MTAGGDLQLEALEAAISPDRLGTYLSEADGDRSLAREFYVWDRDVASAMFADIAIIEVALRNAIHGVLTAHLGERWYELGGIPLDWRATTNLQKAWERLPAQTGRTPTCHTYRESWLRASCLGSGVIYSTPVDTWVRNPGE